MAEDPEFLHADNEETGQMPKVSLFLCKDSMALCRNNGHHKVGALKRKRNACCRSVIEEKLVFMGKTDFYENQISC